jgi:hypothetical protein
MKKPCCTPAEGPERLRLGNGVVLPVSKVEVTFTGMDTMCASIEDTPSRRCQAAGAQRNHRRSSVAADHPRQPAVGSADQPARVGPPVGRDLTRTAWTPVETVPVHLGRT